MRGARRDLRSKSLLGKYEDSHSDDVVQVTFDKYAPTKLFSGGIDQLINVFDVSIRGEEDALIGGTHAGACAGGSHGSQRASTRCG